MKIDSEKLWQSRPEYLNEDMSDEKKSEFNKGWNKCLNEFYEIIKRLETEEIDSLGNCCADDSIKPMIYEVQEYGTN